MPWYGQSASVIAQHFQHRWLQCKCFRFLSGERRRCALCAAAKFIDPSGYGVGLRRCRVTSIGIVAEEFHRNV
jgi:hypothetical protein